MDLGVRSQAGTGTVRIPDPQPPQQDSELFGRAAQAARSNLVMAPVLLLSGFLANVVVARELSPSSYALFAAVIAFRSLMGFLGDLGAGAASTWLFADLQAAGAGPQARRAYRRLALLRLPAAVALIAAAALVPDEIARAINLEEGNRFLIELLALLGIAEITASLGYYALAGTFNHRQTNRITLFVSVLQPVAVVAAAALGGGLAGIAGGVVLGSVAKTIGFNFFAIRAVARIGNSGREVPELTSRFTRVASGSITGKVASILHQRQALTFIGLSVFTRPEVAGFSLAYDFTQQAVAAPAGPIQSLMLPALTSVRHDRDRRQHTFELLTRLLALTVGPLVAALVVLFPVAVPALFGGGYEAAVDFGYVFLPAFGAEMILSGAATALMLSDGSLITPYRTIKLVTIAAAVLYIPALAWSLLAASVLMMAIRVTGALAMHVTIRRRTGLSASGPWVRRWLVTVAATALSTLAVRELLGAHGLVTLAIASAVAACVALGTIRVVGALEARDIELLSRTMPKAARAIALLGPARGQRSSGTTDR